MNGMEHSEMQCNVM